MPCMGVVCLELEEFGRQVADGPMLGIYKWALAQGGLEDHLYHTTHIQYTSTE